MRPTSRPHLDAHALRALLDRQLSLIPRLTAALHLRRCARCRAALAEERAIDARASELLGRLRQK